MSRSKKILSEFEWLEQNEGTMQRTMRDEKVCRGCGSPKDKGSPVCWDCYKYRKDITPFKYFDGDISQWLEQVKKLKAQEREQ
ncbi:hypothetical protein KKC91_07040 [bacterium]|nr:hypothetical protein [bacterium]